MADPSQAKTIANYFIMSSPTGEVDEVVTDVKKLCDLDAGTIQGFLKDYNTERMTFGPDPEGNPCIVSAHGQVGDDLYLDPATGRVMRFHHGSRKFTEVTDQKQVLSPAVAEYRGAIEKCLEDYVSKNYKKGKVSFAVYGADSGAITIAISAANVNLSNFWTGGWRATYQVSSKQGEQDLTGDLRLNVHYFEDGNVQLHCSYPSTTKVPIGDSKAAAEAVVGAIKKGETAFQHSLEELYVAMHDDTFKQMRRFWPMNKQPFNWSPAAHKMTEQLSGGGS